MALRTGLPLPQALAQTHALIHLHASSQPRTSAVPFCSQTVQSKLVSFVMRSRDESSAQARTASANAITVLNAAGHSFAGYDFHGVSIQVRGHGSCESTGFVCRSFG